MTYAVIMPVMTPGVVEPCPVFIADDKDEAIAFAKNTRDKYRQQGWYQWADMIKIVSPRTALGFSQLGEKALEYGQILGRNAVAKNQRSFASEVLIEWASILFIRAEEVANPEHYADL
jgi:hypothetical protein